MRTASKHSLLFTLLVYRSITCSKLTIETLENKVSNMFKVNNKDIRTMPTLKRRRSNIFIANFKHISHLVLVFLLLTLSR